MNVSENSISICYKMKIDLEALKIRIYYQDNINQNIFGKIY